MLVENVVSATGESRKLEPKYRGPYIIKKVLENDRYLVADLKDIQRNQRPYESVFASDKIKRWCTLGPEVNDDESDEEELPENNNNKQDEVKEAACTEGGAGVRIG